MRVVVLGMHRSGTSALTSLVSLLGCYAGSRGDFNAADEWNPRGYWERKDVWALNEEILRKLGRTWYSVTDADLDTLDEDDRRALQARAQDLVRGLDSHGTWVIKDPRLCMLFPIWKRALDDSLIILIHRHPGEVAVSLQRRDDFPIHFATALWESHVLASLKHTKGLPRIVVSHEELLREPVTVAGRLQQELSVLGMGPLREPAEQEIKDIIDPDLYRARIASESEVNQVQRALLDRLEAESLDLPVDAAISQSACIAIKLYAPMRQVYDELLARSTNLLELERDNATKEIESLREHIRNKESALSAHLEEIARLREGCVRVRNEVTRLRTENEVLKKENARLSSWLDILSVDLALLLRSRRMKLLRLIPDVRRLRFGEWFWTPGMEKTHGDFIKWWDERRDRWKCRDVDDGS